MQTNPTFGAIDIPFDGDDLFGGEVDKGVFKVFKEIIYNQTKVDNYSCTLVATYGAISDITGVKFPYYLMKQTLGKMIKDKKFTPGVGAKMIDGVIYSIADISKYLKKNIGIHQVIMNVNSCVYALQKGSPVVTGIKYGKGYFTDEQDNAWIDSYLSGTGGHAIRIVKANTYDDHLGKLVENYEGKNKNNVIGFDFNRAKAHNLFFNTGFYFTM